MLVYKSRAIEVDATAHPEVNNQIHKTTWVKGYQITVRKGGESKVFGVMFLAGTPNPFLDLSPSQAASTGIDLVYTAMFESEEERDWFLELEKWMAPHITRENSAVILNHRVSLDGGFDSVVLCQVSEEGIIPCSEEDVVVAMEALKEDGA